MQQLSLQTCFFVCLDMIIYAKSKLLEGKKGAVQAVTSKAI